MAIDQEEQPFDSTLVRPTLTLSEAEAAGCGSRSTVRRALDAKKFPDAWRDDGPGGPRTGPWRIPVDNLISAGYPPNRATTSVVSAPEQDHDTAPDTPLNSPEVALVRAEGERDRWRSVAEERAVALDDLRGALRMLNAGPSTTGPTRGRPSRTALVVGTLIVLLVVALVVTLVL